MKAWAPKGLGFLFLLVFLLRAVGLNFGIKVEISGTDIALCVLAVGLLLRDELAPLLSRIKKVKWGDKEVELSEAAENLTSRVELIVNAEPSPVPVTQLPGRRRDQDEALLQIAAINPSLAVVEIARRMKGVLTQILMSNGWIDRANLSGQTLIARAIENKVLTPQMGQALKDYWSIRNAVAHSLEVSQTIQSSVIESGLQLLEQLESLQTKYERHEVAVPSVEIFVDPACEKKIPGENAVILKTVREGKETFRIYPTRKDYRTGQVLSWQWDMTPPTLGEAWFKDPLNGGRVTQAWSSAAHFAGEPIG